MEIALTTPLRRDPDTTPLDDLTASVRTGPAVWWSEQAGASPSRVIIPFDVEPVAAEVDKIRIRLVTGSANEETLRTRAENALASNTSWRTNTAPQLLAGADKILTGTLALTASQQEKDLAQAVKTLTNRVDALCEQNNALVRLLLSRFDSTA